MLVLSRRVNERVFFPQLGITLKVIRAKGNTVRLGIDAPDEIKIVREEVHNRQVEQDVPFASSSWHGADANDTYDEFRSAGEKRLLENKLSAASLAIHLAQNQLRNGLNEHALQALDDAVHCLQSLESTVVQVGASPELSDPFESRRGRQSHGNLAVKEPATAYATIATTMPLVTPERVVTPQSAIEADEAVTLETEEDVSIFVGDGDLGFLADFEHSSYTVTSG